MHNSRKVDINMKQKIRINQKSEETSIDNTEVTDQALAEAFSDAKKEEKPAKPKKVSSEPQGKQWIVFLVVGIVGLLGGVGCALFALLRPKAEVAQMTFPKIPSSAPTEATYSDLTGEVLSDPALKTAPAYCVQTPNGTDGARPQAGLDQAGVIFEAIAESGITRFAALYQNPSSAVIGPIRSLRIYYLQWDTPFDCTIVHAGGADDALAAVASGGYKDLSENYAYMYRGNAGARRWNNLFTTSTLLKQYDSDHGYTSSNINGFSRMTPEESNRARIDALASEKLDITKPATGDTSALSAKTSAVGLRFGGWPSFNVNYNYDLASNKYFRSYESGDPHNIYSCPGEDLGERNPEDVCELTQMAPSVVVAMMVEERRASDNYHEDIDAIGSGTAYVFQNGTAIEGTWSKASAGDQIKFTDTAGNEIKLAPGQTFVSAIPNYGGVEF